MGSSAEDNGELGEPVSHKSFGLLGKVGKRRIEVGEKRGNSESANIKFPHLAFAPGQIFPSGTCLWDGDGNTRIVFVVWALG